MVIYLATTVRVSSCLTGAWLLAVSSYPLSLLGGERKVKMLSGVSFYKKVFVPS